MLKIIYIKVSNDCVDNKKNLKTKKETYGYFEKWVVHMDYLKISENVVKSYYFK